MFVPTWNIETWLTYLGGEAVDESRPNYQRLAKPRDCLNHAIALKDMCNRQDLRHPSPESLNIACCEYQDRL